MVPRLEALAGRAQKWPFARREPNPMNPRKRKAIRLVLVGGYHHAEQAAKPFVGAIAMPLPPRISSATQRGMVCKGLSKRIPGRNMCVLSIMFQGSP